MLKGDKPTSPNTSPQPGRMVTRSVTNTPKSSHGVEERPTPPRVTRGRGARRALFVGEEDQDYESPPQPKRRKTSSRDGRRFDVDGRAQPGNRPGRPANTIPSRPTSNQKPNPIPKARVSRHKQRVVIDIFPGCPVGGRLTGESSISNTPEKSPKRDDGSSGSNHSNSSSPNIPPSTGPTVPIPPPLPIPPSQHHAITSLMATTRSTTSTSSTTSSGASTPTNSPRLKPTENNGLPLSLSLTSPNTTPNREKCHRGSHELPSHPAQAVPKVPSLITMQSGDSTMRTGRVPEKDRRKAKEVCNFLSTAARRWAVFEWFYPSIDYYYFNSSDFVKMMSEYQAENLVGQFNRDELNVLRMRMEKPLRMSKRYFAQERGQLQKYREAVRHCHTRAPIAHDKFSHLQGYDIPAPLRKGHRVQVLCPVSFQVRQALVLKPKDTGYRIRYDEAYGMADELVSDSCVMCIGEVEKQRPPSPMRSRRRAAVASPYSQPAPYTAPPGVTQSPRLHPTLPPNQLRPGMTSPLPAGQHPVVTSAMLSPARVPSNKMEHPQVHHTSTNTTQPGNVVSVATAAYHMADKWRLRAEEVTGNQMDIDGPGVNEPRPAPMHQAGPSIDRVQLAKLYCTVQKKIQLVNQLKHYNTEGEKIKTTNTGETLNPEFLRLIEHITNDIRSLNVAISHLLENLTTNPQDSQVNLQHAQSLLHHQIMQSHPAAAAAVAAQNVASAASSNTAANTSTSSAGQLSSVPTNTSTNTPTSTIPSSPSHGPPTSLCPPSVCPSLVHSAVSHSINRKHVPSHPNSMCGELFEKTRQQAKLIVANCLNPRVDKLEDKKNEFAEPPTFPASPEPSKKREGSVDSTSQQPEEQDQLSSYTSSPDRTEQQSKNQEEEEEQQQQQQTQQSEKGSKAGQDSSSSATGDSPNTGNSKPTTTSTTAVPNQQSSESAPKLPPDNTGTVGGNAGNNMSAAQGSGTTSATLDARTGALTTANIPTAPTAGTHPNKLKLEKHDLGKTVNNLITQTVAFLMHLRNCLDPTGPLQQVPSSLAVTLDSALLAMRPESPPNVKAHEDLTRLVRLVKEQIIGESSDYY